MDFQSWQVFKDFAAAHPIYACATTFLLGAAVPRLWQKFLGDWLPEIILAVLLFLESRGMTIEEEMALDDMFNIIYTRILARVTQRKAAALAAAQAALQPPAPVVAP